MMKTRIFVAKQFAKKHYKGAMDAMKSFKGKIKKPKGIKKEKTIAGVKKVKSRCNITSCWFWIRSKSRWFCSRKEL